MSNDQLNIERAMSQVLTNRALLTALITAVGGFARDRTAFLTELNANASKAIMRTAIANGDGTDDALVSETVRLYALEDLDAMIVLLRAGAR